MLRKAIPVLREIMRKMAAVSSYISSASKKRTQTHCKGLPKVPEANWKTGSDGEELSCIRASSPCPFKVDLGVDVGPFKGIRIDSRAITSGYEHSHFVLAALCPKCQSVVPEIWDATFRKNKCTAAVSLLQAQEIR